MKKFVDKPKSEQNGFIYGVTDRPPWVLLLIYGLQWVFLLFPSLLTAVTLCDHAFSFSPDQRIRFIQLTFVISGVFTVIQSLWGHGYPILEGPATAHILTTLFLAHLGIPAIQGGMILGGITVSITTLCINMAFIRKVFTRNVVIVILLLIAFSLLPHLVKDLSGETGVSRHPRWIVLLCSALVMLGTALLSERLKGLVRSFALLIGICAGTGFFMLMGISSETSQLFAHSPGPIPALWTPFSPSFISIAVASCIASYAAVVVNAMGSLAGMAALTSEKGDSLDTRFRRCLVINGLSGVVSGFTGTVGLVSYGVSPGIVVMQRVSSRYVITACGVITIFMGFVPKVAAFCAMVPPAVVASVVCVAMGSQVAAALNMMRESSQAGRDGTVIGLSLIMGLVVALVPENVLMGAPAWARLLLKNSLISGIIVALLLEHIIVRGKGEQKS